MDKLVAALELLKELQWVVHSYDPAHGHSERCPVCGGVKNKASVRTARDVVGHRTDCKLKELLQK